MAEEKKDEAAEGAETVAPAKSSKKKLYIIIGAVLVLIIAAGVPVFLMTRKADSGKVAELDEDAAEGKENLHPEGHADEDELVEGEEILGAIFPLETFIVNLTGNRYIRLQAQLEFNGREIPSRFYGRIIPIRDKIIATLSAKSQEELQAPKDKDLLKKEIKDIVNQVLKKEEVKQVYFSQFIVQ